jgi:uncharacterized membrane protein
MHSNILAAFFVFDRTATPMCIAGLAVFCIGAWVARKDFSEARGVNKIAAIGNLCFAIPLAVFGTLHLFGAQFILPLVPKYMPWRMFWVYFIGCALIAAALSIATGIAVRWSGLLVGIMMFMFVGMLYLPFALKNLYLLLQGAAVTPNARINVMIVCRESSFGGAAWIYAAAAKNGWRGPVKIVLTTVGRILISITAIVFGIEHFLHPLGLPGVPLVREMPVWVPARPAIDYVTGAALLVAGVSFLLNKKTHEVATWVGGWILLLLFVIYGPVLISSLSGPTTGVQVEGVNYFADTLLFIGVILSMASATSATASREKTASTGS